MTDYFFLIPIAIGLGLCGADWHHAPDRGSRCDAHHRRVSRGGPGAAARDGGGFDHGGQTVGGGQGTDTLSGIERVIGSRFNDTLLGSANSDSFVGGFGKDTIVTQDGRVRRPESGDDTVSEGQAYLLLRAAWMDDRAAFDRIRTGKAVQRKEVALIEFHQHRILIGQRRGGWRQRLPAPG